MSLRKTSLYYIVCDVCKTQTNPSTKKFPNKYKRKGWTRVKNPPMAKGLDRHYCPIHAGSV